MSQAASAPTSTGPAAAAARFLAELENTFSSLRLYGPGHPAFVRSVEAAAAASQPPIRLSVTPRGFVIDKTPLEDPVFLPLARRLRALGLIGLEVESALSSPRIIELVTALKEMDGGTTAQVAVQRIAQATGGAVKAVPLRLDRLKLVEGTAGSAGDDQPSSSLWSDLFAEACHAGTPGSASVRELAHSFEAALGGNPSGQEWDAMVESWSRQLVRIGASLPADAADDPEPPPGGHANPFDGVSGFLQAVSPHLCQRLMAETINREIVPEPIVLELAQRLPATIVLGALSAVDRTNGQPSSAALALLRKVSAQVNDNTLDAAAAAQTRQDIARTAASLEKLLQSNREASFVPDEYLHRRQELSRERLAPQPEDHVTCPDDRDTAQHAAELVLQMLCSSDADLGHLAAGLEFLKGRLGAWIKAGQFAHAAQALVIAHSLQSSPDETVSAAARALIGLPLHLDELLEGVRRFAGRSSAAATDAPQAVATLLGRCDGAVIAQLLESTNLKAGVDGVDIVTDALRLIVTDAPEDCLRGMMGGVGEKAPPALLAIFQTLDPARTIKALEALLPHATPPVRRDVLWKVFTRNIPWPLPFTQRMLRDDEPGVRRLALMRLMRDNDLSVAAGHLVAASTTHDYPPDVALGLAELLRPHRRDPQVKPAYRKWFWSGRRWGALFSLSIGAKQRRRAG